MQYSPAETGNVPGSGDANFINFQPSGNFRNMKKYLKFKYESTSDMTQTDDQCDNSETSQAPPMVTEQPAQIKHETKPIILQTVSSEQPAFQQKPPVQPAHAYSLQSDSSQAMELENDDSNESTSKETNTTPAPTQKTMCRDFVRGVCTQGVKCIFVHEIIHAQLPDVYTFCRNYQNRSCTYDQCKFVHATVFEKECFYRTGVLPAHAFAHLPYQAWGVHSSPLMPLQITPKPQASSPGSITWANQSTGEPVQQQEMKYQALVPYYSDTNISNPATTQATAVPDMKYGIVPMVQTQNPLSTNPHTLYATSNSAAMTSSVKNNVSPLQLKRDWLTAMNTDDEDSDSDSETNFKGPMTKKCKSCDSRVSLLVKVNDRLWILAKKLYAKMSEFKAMHHSNYPPNSITTKRYEQFKIFEKETISTINLMIKQVGSCTRSIDNTMKLKPKRNSLTFHGIPEYLSEDCRTTILMIIHSIGFVNITEVDIVSCCRIGVQNKDHCRPILARFLTADIRSAIWKARAKLLSSQIVVKEYVVKSRLSIFMKAHQYFGEQAHMSREGIQVKLTNGERYKISSLEELDRLIATKSAYASSPSTISGGVVSASHNLCK